MENKPNDIILICNSEDNRIDKMKDVFEFLNTHNVGKINSTHFCCLSNVGIPEHINIKGKEMFNALQQKARTEGVNTICYCKSIML